MKDLRAHWAGPLLLAALILSAVSLTAPEARADNSTVAEALFSEGRRLLDEKQYDKACAKFAESQRLDPATGTLLNLANCYQLAERNATAWSTWKEAASSARDAGQKQREEYAREKAKELEGTLAKLTIDVPEEARVDGMTITRDGEELPSAIWGAPLPVDAKTHTLVASAPGYEAQTLEITLDNGQTESVTIPALVKKEVVATDDPQPAPAAATAATPEDSAQSGKTQRLVGYVVGGVGLVGIGVGTYFGIDALNKYDDSKAFCSPSDPNLCQSEGVDLRNDARTSGTISTVAIGVGAAAVIGGVVLVLTAPKGKTSVAAVPTYDGGTLFLRGQF